jgi:hypothetical protein
MDYFYGIFIGAYSWNRFIRFICSNNIKRIYKIRFLLSEIPFSIANGRAQVNLDPLEIEKIPCISDPMFKALKRKITMGF